MMQVAGTLGFIMLLLIKLHKTICIMKSHSTPWLVGQSLKKLRSNFLKAFWVDLKACLGLVLPAFINVWVIIILCG